MTLGVSKPRNWGKEDQIIALELTLKNRNVAFKVNKDLLFLAPSKNGLTLSFSSVARIEHNRRGSWIAYSIFDDSQIESACTERDLIRKTIQKLWR